MKQLKKTKKDKPETKKAPITIQQHSTADSYPKLYKLFDKYFPVLFVSLRLVQIGSRIPYIFFSNLAIVTGK